MCVSGGCALVRRNWQNKAKRKSSILRRRAHLLPVANPEKGRAQGLKQFLDDKSIKPGLQGYKRPE